MKENEAYENYDKEKEAILSVNSYIKQENSQESVFEKADYDYEKIKWQSLEEEIQEMKSFSEYNLQSDKNTFMEYEFSNKEPIFLFELFYNYISQKSIK